jgi:hypothetical protein
VKLQKHLKHSKDRKFPQKILEIHAKTLNSTAEAQEEIFLFAI